MFCLYSISGFDAKAFHNSLIEGNEEAAEEITKSIALSKIFTGRERNEVCPFLSY